MGTYNIVKTDHTYVQKDPAICGGDPIITGTRIPIRFIYLHHQAGDSAETIQRRYPGLTLAHIYDALSYAYDHLSDIEEEVRREKAAYEQGQQEQSA